MGGVGVPALPQAPLIWQRHRLAGGWRGDHGAINEEELGFPAADLDELIASAEFRDKHASDGELPRLADLMDPVRRAKDLGLGEIRVRPEGAGRCASTARMAELEPRRSKVNCS
jgi:hypothetical protein